MQLQHHNKPAPHSPSCKQTTPCLPTLLPNTQSLYIELPNTEQWLVSPRVHCAQLQAAGVQLLPQSFKHVCVLLPLPGLLQAKQGLVLPLCQTGHCCPVMH